jgi:ribonuclease BN (tRNA processing enzyme)
MKSYLQNHVGGNPVRLLLILIFITCLASNAHSQDNVARDILDSSSSTQIVLLGTGTPNADPERQGPSLAIVVNGMPYLVDFGPGVVRRAAAAHLAGIEGLAVKKLTRAFVTHLHSDHTAGYSDLILTPWVLERNEPLEVYGPDGIVEMTEHILAAYEQDIRIRLDGLEPANDSGHRVNAHVVEPGRVYEDANVKVDAFLVPHGDWPKAYGYVFHTPDRKIVISGDTTPTDSIVAKCDGCDVLIHEVYSQAGFERRDSVWQEYHKDSHTSSHELAELATRAKPKLLILYHQLFWGSTEEELLEEVRSRYDGEVVSGHDLDVY